MTDYKPVDCSLYSDYELAIMHRQPLRLSWRDTQGMIHIAVYRPLDMYTRQGEEFMVVMDTDRKESHIRLDYILSYNPA
ncbi:MAG: transcriptional antiterminator, Rof [Gammaproteobacteria bacterium]|nr:MAG: transcriptional antiterminator, Rof [Gammaproteobacteria bacterium]